MFYDVMYWLFNLRDSKNKTCWDFLRLEILRDFETETLWDKAIWRISGLSKSFRDRDFIESLANHWDIVPTEGNGSDNWEGFILILKIFEKCSHIRGDGEVWTVYPIFQYGASFLAHAFMGHLGRGGSIQV